ncbi:MAG TPA: phosphoribosyltransferase [Desulfurobacteriaceae bacterium]|nr:phosphoribosyltransferase [Desulfurobacteriaceae bacterium]
MKIFKDRFHAGKLLSEKLRYLISEKYLEDYKNDNIVVLAIPRGGVEVGYIIAREFDLPLRVIIPRKIGAPFNEEFAIGAVTEDGEVLLNTEALLVYNIPKEYILRKVEEELKEIKRRKDLYQGFKEDISLKDKVVILVDDGIATGLTVKAALNFIKKQNPKAIVLAVPVLPADRVEDLKKLVDDLIYVEAPIDFWAVGQFYENFPQTDHETVVRLLKDTR